MAVKSYKQCIADNDYKSAIRNFKNTTERWKKHWWECLETLYLSCKEFMKNYILDAANMLVYPKPRTKYDTMIDSNGFDIKAKQGEVCYLFEFFNSEKQLICSKVGTTTRTIRQRLIEELRSKTYTAMGVEYARVNRVYVCGNMPAEGLESLIRSCYIKKFPQAFRKNDRFLKEYFDFLECDEIAKKYLAIS